jgi:hypothetical protein
VPRRTFTAGQAVEVRRDTSPNTKWEPATYDRSFPDWRGWHRVELASDRYVNVRTGNDCKPDDPAAVKTRALCIPTQRLREKQK